MSVSVLVAACVTVFVVASEATFGVVVELSEPVALVLSVVLVSSVVVPEAVLVGVDVEFVVEVALEVVSEADRKSVV